MLYKIEMGIYEGQRRRNLYTSLSLPKDLDKEYSKEKKMRHTNYFKLTEYEPLLKKWSHVFSMMF